MGDASASGRFWLCPQCKRHVPQRIDACRCGYAKASNQAQPIDAEIVGSAPEPSRAMVHMADSQPGQIVVAPGAQPPARTLQITLNAQNAGWIAAIGLGAWVIMGRGGAAPPQQPTVVVVTMPAAPQQAPAATPEPQVEESAGATEELFPGTLAEPAATPADTQGVAAPSFTPQPTAAPEDPAKAEPYWRTKLLQSRDRIDGAYNGCVSQFSNMAHGVGLAGSDSGAAGSAWEGARSNLYTAVTAQQQLEEDARQAGVPPGWVRFDWTRFPELDWRQGVGGARAGASAIGTEGNTHPCSVPGILKSIRY